MSGTGPIVVHGGPAGIEVRLDDLEALARCLGALADDCLGAALALHAYLLRPVIVESALIDPFGAAEFTADLLGALDGVNGMSWVAAEAGTLAVALRAAVLAYRAVDRLSATMGESLVAVLRLPGAIDIGARTWASTHDLARSAQAAITADPEMADAVIDALGLPALLARIARTLPDGHGVAIDDGIDTSAAGRAAPRNLAGLMDDLGRRDDDPRHGEIDVRIITAADGARHVVVDLTGTKRWSLAPSPDVADPITDARAIAGDRTAYEQGVLAAMRQAGVRSTDDVMIVGHSEGGLVALTTARDADASGEFHVTEIVTAGAPIGRTVGALPRSVQVLALENSIDVVPHLDGTENPAAPNVTTVTGTAGDRTVVGDHQIGTGYLPIAAAADASRNGSVRAFVRDSREFLTDAAPGQIVTHTFQIERR